MTEPRRVLEQMRLGLAPPPAVVTTLGMRLIEVGRGTVTATMIVPPDDGGPGFLSALADFTLGAAIMTELPPGRVVRTRRLEVAGVTPLLAGRSLVSRSTLEGIGSDDAASSGDVRDEHGDLVATTSCHCAIRPETTRPETTRPADDGSAPPTAVDPVAALRMEADGGGIVRACAAPTLSNRGGLLQGGVIAAVVERVARSAMKGRAPADAAHVDVEFRRGIPADGADVHVTAAVEHGRAGVVGCRIDRQDGAPAVTATVTFSAG